jgi:hypothetical protein
MNQDRRVIRVDKPMTEEEQAKADSKLSKKKRKKLTKTRRKAMQKFAKKARGKVKDANYDSHQERDDRTARRLKHNSAQTSMTSLSTGT